MIKKVRKESVRQSLRRNIIDRRAKLSLSQEALAMKAGVSRPMISSLEQGRGNPTLAALESIATAMGLRLVDLLQPDTGSSETRGTVKAHHRQSRFSAAGRKPSYRNWLANPPAGSKVAAARDFGVDLTLLMENLSLTPLQRLQKLAATSSMIQGLKAARPMRPRRHS